MGMPFAARQRAYENVLHAGAAGQQRGAPEGPEILARMAPSQDIVADHLHSLSANAVEPTSCSVQPPLRPTSLERLRNSSDGSCASSLQPLIARASMPVLAAQVPAFADGT